MQVDESRSDGFRLITVSQRRFVSASANVISSASRTLTTG